VDWIRPRRGLGNASVALRSDTARVAYLGASVTVQREGFRPLLHAHVTRAFGRPHVAVNAAVGAVGSVSAVFLMDALVLAHAPALCFVEYTTGDWGGRSSAKDIGPAVEGIVRKLVAHGIDACLLHLWRGDRVCDWPDPVIDTYERIADHYGVPSILAGRVIADGLGTEATRAAWFRDVVHTTPAGAARTAGIIADAFDALCAVPPALRTALPAPLHADHFGHGRVVLARNLLRDRADVAWPVFRLTYPYLDLDESRALSFRSSHALKGLFIVVGPASTPIRVTADGTTHAIDPRDEWTDYERISTVIFDESLPPGADVRLEREAEGDMKVIGFLVHDPLNLDSTRPSHDTLAVIAR